MDSEAIFSDDARIPFDGPHSNLAFLVDPDSLIASHGEEPWPQATVAFRAPGVHATMTASFFPGALAAFARDLAAAHTALQGSVTLDSEDGDFRLTVTYEKQGHVVLSGQLQPNRYERTILNYEIVTDQSYLSASLLALR